ncbi:hypothetical protein BV898_05931 [Hypsibius exemplaris]|uniref:Uncharacterized protein n=1 Tax=Hypsibius exemplaris TaxID=2072580 RepID=A0A1W0WY76_HYPEX|nr:hypothetical protein BV898_05931 [Hypsibius exemplaris]
MFRWDASCRQTLVLLYCSCLLTITGPVHGDADDDAPLASEQEEHSVEFINILGLFELSSCELAKNGRLEAKAAQLAVKLINERAVIPGYQLRLFANDTMYIEDVDFDRTFQGPMHSSAVLGMPTYGTFIEKNAE